MRKHYSRLSSTQDEIDKYLEQVSSPQQWVMVSADTQEGGKGLWGRYWVSPVGNVFVTYSMLMPIARMKYLPIIPALTLVKTLEDYGQTARIRWINNIVVSNLETSKDQKIGGILCGGNLMGPYCQAKIGIGINVNMTKEKCERIDQPATSLSCLLKKQVSPEEVLQKLTRHLYEFMVSPIQDDQLICAYRRSLVYIGEKVQIFNGEKCYEGLFKNVNDVGYLILQTASGEETFVSGEIVPR